jgi:hypothetical protein
MPRDSAPHYGEGVEREAFNGMDVNHPGRESDFEFNRS